MLIKSLTAAADDDDALKTKTNTSSKFIQYYYCDENSQYRQINALQQYA